MKDFSIILPTRERTLLLTNLLNSIAENTKNLGSVEVLVAIDEDDTHEYEQIFYGLSFVKFFRVPRSLNFSRDYYTYLAKKSTGKWIIACNDDCEFQTKDWDVAVHDTLAKYVCGKANVVYGWSEDMLGQFRLTQFGNYCCFPLIGRDGFDALGCYFPENIPTWGADIWIEKLYRNVGKCVKIPMVIKHISHHNQLREQDHINKRIAMNQVTCDMNPTHDQINKLIDAINGAKINV